MTEAGETLISFEEVYKIFGPNPRGRAFELSQGCLLYTSDAADE